MGYISGYQGELNPSLQTTIAASGTESGVVSTGGLALCGIILPATFTGTALTFKACATSGGTFVVVKKSDGSSLSYTVAQGTYVAVDPKDFQGVAFLKIVSGSTEGSDRILTLSLKGF